MTGRAGLIVVIIAGLFIAGVGALSVVRRSQPREPKAPSPAPVAESSSAPSVSASVPVETSAPEEVAWRGVRLEVVDEAAKPIEGARALDTNKMSTLVATSNEQGLMAIPYTSLHFWLRDDAVLRIEHDRFAPQSMKVRQSDERLRITLKASAIMYVEVVDTTTRPLAGAEVKVDEIETGYYSPAWVTRSWKTDDNGQVRVTGIPFGALVFRAAAKGYEEGRAFIIALEGEVRTVRLTLVQGRRLNVTVRSRSGEPVKDAKVELSHGHGGMTTSYTGGYGSNFWTRVSDKSGAASFDSLPANMSKGRLRARSRTHSTTTLMIDLIDSVTEVEVTLEPGATMKVDVVDPEGRSVSCVVLVSGRDLNNPSDNQREKAAGATATFEGLPTDSPIRVIVRRDNAYIHLEAGIILKASETRELTIKLPSQFLAKFRARDKQASPVAGWLEITRVKSALGPPVVGLGNDYLSYSALIGDDGTGELSVFVGVYKAKFTPREGASVEKEVRIEADIEVDLEVASQATLMGVIVDSTGHAMPGVKVTWHETGANGATTTGPDGRFSLKRLIGGAGKVYVHVAGVTVDAYSGPPPMGDLRLVIPMATLRGRVIRSDGHPGWGLVSVAPKTTRGFEWGESIPPVSTKRDGSFEMRLHAAVWNVWVYGEASIPNPKPVQVDLSSAGAIVDVTIPLVPISK